MNPHPRGYDKSIKEIAILVYNLVLSILLLHFATKMTSFRQTQRKIGAYNFSWIFSYPEDKAKIVASKVQSFFFYKISLFTIFKKII